MPYQNEPSRSNRRQPHSPRASRNAQRVNVPHARDELERERELYSARDPHRSTKSPAQRATETRTHQGSEYHRTTRIGDSISSDDLRENPAPSSRIPRVPGTGASPSHTDEYWTHTRERASRTSANTNDHTAYARDNYTRSSRARTASTDSWSADAYVPPMDRTANAYCTGNPNAASRTPGQVRDQEFNERSRYTRGTAGRQQGATNPVRSVDYGASRYLNNKRPPSGPLSSARSKIIAIVATITVVAIGVFAFQTWQNTKEVQVTINGQQQTIAGDQRSLQGLLNTNTVSVKPGNYVAVDGSVMREGEGTRATANVNGTDTTDLSLHLNEGDTISLTDGVDITEEYTDSDPQVLPASLELKGSGAVHVYTQKSEAGEKVTRTGKESGKTAEITTKEPVNGVVQYYNVNSNGEKVIALTFDDGPWDSTTQAILDILKENDAKATFYTVGQMISGHEDLLKRAVNEGHELATHTWDHAEGSGQGVSLILMSSEERKTEIEKGLQAIRDATGTEPSLMFRAPGGNFDQSVASDLNGLVTAEIGWNIDTTDWKRPGADTIAQRIESVEPGGIVLMHDGGGDRTQTVEGLRQALPKLKEQGYTFVTVEELLSRYPYQEGQSA